MSFLGAMGGEIVDLTASDPEESDHDPGTKDPERLEDLIPEAALAHVRAAGKGGAVLQFQQDIVDELLEKDGLTCIAEGLGLVEIIALLLKEHTVPGGTQAGHLAREIPRLPETEAADTEDTVDDASPPKLEYQVGQGAVLILGLNDFNKAALKVHCGLHGMPFPPVVTAEVTGTRRDEIYRNGGPMFVTTRIAAVDILREALPQSNIQGVIVANGHRVTDMSQEAFVIRLFRSGNRAGFLRALTDRPGELCRGFSKVDQVMKYLMTRELHLWPRFQLTVKACLDSHAPEVIELRQPLSDRVRKIQEAIVHVMDECMTELKKSRHVDTSELTVEAGLFKSFDRIVQRQLDPVWNVVSRRLKQVVWDLRTLRNLANFLLRYDAVTFLRYLETLRMTEGSMSMWMFTESAHTIFEQARRRVYVLRKTPAPAGLGEGVGVGAKKRRTPATDNPAPSALHMVLEPMPKWRLIEEIVREIETDKTKLFAKMEKYGVDDATLVGDLDESTDESIASFLRHSLDVRVPMDEGGPSLLERYGQGPTLIVAKDEATAMQLTGMLLRGADGMMRSIWQKYLRQRKASGELAKGKTKPAPVAGRGGRVGGGGRGGRGGRFMSKMDRMRAAMMGEAVPSGPPGAGGRGARDPAAGPTPGRGGRGGRGGGRSMNAAVIGTPAERDAIAAEADRLHKEELKKTRAIEAPAAKAAAAAGHKQATGDLDPAGPPPPKGKGKGKGDKGASKETTNEGEDDVAEERAFSGDLDDLDVETPEGAAIAADLLAERDVYVHALTDRAAVLATVWPSFIVVHDPDAAFIREIEMHAAHRPGARMRVYFMVHDTSVEEQRYLSQIRYESDSFANLIRGKAHAAMPFEQEGRVYNATPLAIAGTSGASAAPVLPLPQLAPLVDPKALAASRNTRQRGGQLSVPTKLHVVVDIREFMSSLPSILHQSGFKVMPCTLEVGDYVLSPSMCVERKSLPDLIESLRNGRLVTQMQNMCRHYKIPILLIEFERDKAFGIQNPADVPKDLNYNTTQGRLAMLVMRFPKMRIMWSRSLHMTAKMFADWKYAEEEPTIEVASKVGVPQGGSGEPGAVNHAVNQAAIDMLRRLPGVTDSNYRRVMTAPGITCLADLADVTMERLQEILGDPRQGRTLYEFLHAQYPVHMMGGGR